MESCPLISMVVPATDTVFVLLMEPQDAVTVIMRFDLSPPVLRVAVAWPEASVVALLTMINPEDAEKPTV